MVELDRKKKLLLNSMVPTPYNVGYATGDAISSKNSKELL